jgi:hypothetical protein
MPLPPELPELMFGKTWPQANNCKANSRSSEFASNLVRNHSGAWPTPPAPGQVFLDGVRDFSG